MGWLSPALSTLNSQHTPLQSGPLTIDQLSWLGGVISIGALVGNFLFTIVGTYLGQKMSMFLLAFPNLVSNAIYA